MNEDNRNRPSLGRCVLAGLIAGVVGALFANLAALILSHHFNQSFDQLNWFSIARASLISCIAGAFVYAGLVRWTRRPLLFFGAIALAMALLDSFFVSKYPPVAGFGRIANPLHFVVAITAIVVIPALAPAIPQPAEKRPAR